MDPVSSLNSNTAQFYVAYSKDANISYAANIDKGQEKDVSKTVSKTNEKSKSTESDTESEKNSKLEKDVPTSYIVDIMDEDDDGVITTKEIINYYKGLATTKQEQLDKQIEDLQTVIQETKKETKQGTSSTSETTNTTVQPEKKDIVSPEEEAKKIKGEIGFKDGENPNEKEIKKETEKNDVIEENRKAFFSTHDNKNLPSFMSTNRSQNDTQTSNVVSIDKNQQEQDKSPLELERPSKTQNVQDEEEVSPLELKANPASSKSEEEASNEEKNALSIDEKEEETQDNVYNINDYKLKKALNSYQTVETDSLKYDYSSKISVNI